MDALPSESPAVTTTKINGPTISRDESMNNRAGMTKIISSFVGVLSEKSTDPTKQKNTHQLRGRVNREGSARSKDHAMLHYIVMAGAGVKTCLQIRHARIAVWRGRYRVWV